MGTCSSQDAVLPSNQHNQPHQPGKIRKTTSFIGAGDDVKIYCEKCCEYQPSNHRCLRLFKRNK